MARDRAWTEAWLDGVALDEDPGSPDRGNGDEDRGDSSGSTTWEPNESVSEAVPLSLPVDVMLELTPGDVDHFAIDLDEPTEVTVRIAFTHATGDLDLALLDEWGESLAISASTGDEERITATLPTGRSIVRMYGFQGAATDYRLQVR